MKQPIIAHPVKKKRRLDIYQIGQGKRRRLANLQRREMFISLRCVNAITALRLIYSFPCSRAAVRVFSINIARVMGPTPPGTGVM